MARYPKRDVHQIAALPLRLSSTGKLRVLLVTSRESGRWVLPKGWPMQGKKDRTAARIEALEEAGATGTTAKAPLGSYRYRKRLPGGKRVRCRVEVYPMQVSGLLDIWKEKGQRRRRWVSVKKAASLVQEKELAALFLDLRGTKPASAFLAKLFP